MTTTTDKVDLGHGFTMEKLENGRIVVFTTDGNASHEAFDAWIKGRALALENWDVSKPILFMHDFSKVSFTRYGMRKSDEFDRSTSKELHGKVAIVIAPTPIGHVIRLGAQAASRVLGGRFTVRMVFSREEGLAWLRQWL